MSRSKSSSRWLREHFDDVYVKKAHLDAIPGLRQFLILYADNWGQKGPLVRRGLIASPPAIQARSRAIIAGEVTLDPAALPS